MLNLSRNNLTDIAPLINAIAEAPKHLTLRRLLLQGNQVADRALRELQSAVSAPTCRSNSAPLGATATQSQSGGSAEPPAAGAAGVDGVAVSVRRLFQPSCRLADRCAFAPSVRRGFPQRRDQATQVFGVPMGGGQRRLR